MFKNFLNFSKKIEEVPASEEDVSSVPRGNLGRSITYSMLALALIIAFAYVLKSVLVPVLFSIILASLMFPVCTRLERLGFTRAMASLTSLLLMILVLAGLVYLLVFQSINIGQDASEIVSKIETVLKDAEHWADEKLNLSRTQLITTGKQQLEKAMPKMGAALGLFFGSLGNFLSLGILVPLIIFFLLYYREFFKAFFVRAIGREHQQQVETTFTKIYEAIKNYMGGLLMVMGIVAVLNGVGLMIIGIEHAWFFGILASLLMLLPYIGIAIGSILPALFALATKDSYWYALAVVGWFQLVQILEGNFITPNIVGGKVSLNPLVSILSIFLFSMLFGFAGLILALPMMAILKVIFDAVPQLQPYGFLFSEPGDRFLLTDKQKLKAAKKKALGEQAE
ncbi:MAG: AI-2E family transporter [Sphingobacteriales bacterium]|nr:MAG: AI-2E family transporter [Sphingobacteriales bacterium]